MGSNDGTVADAYLHCLVSCGMCTDPGSDSTCWAPPTYTFQTCCGGQHSRAITVICCTLRPHNSMVALTNRTKPVDDRITSVALTAAVV